MFDGVAFGKEIVGIVRGYVERSLTPLTKRIDDLEGRSVGITEADARHMVAAAVREAVAELPAPALVEPWRPSEEELRALIQPMVDALPTPENGKSVSAEDVRPIIIEQVAKAVSEIDFPEPAEPSNERLMAIIAPLIKALPKPENGKSVSAEDVRPIIIEQVAKAVSEIDFPEPAEPSNERLMAIIAPLIKALPKPENGRSVTIEDVQPMIVDQLAEAVSRLQLPEPAEPSDERLKGLIEPIIDALPRPLDGKNVTVDDVQPLIKELVEKAVAALPPPKDGIDGTSVSADELVPLIKELVDKATALIPMPINGKDGRDGKDGKDGRDGLDAVTPILKDGVLLFTMSNGSIKEVGLVQGQDGKDGIDGNDGADGLGFDDMSADYDGERGIVLRFIRGEQTKQFSFCIPVVIDRGVWLEQKDGGYAKGDGVTWAGSFWISQKDENADKPDGGDGWRLAVKRGRDGKPGKDAEIKAHQPVKVS